MCARVRLAAAGGDRAELRGPRPPSTRTLRGLRATSYATRPPAGERPRRAPAPARLCPTCPGALGRAGGRERKALPLGRAGQSCAAEDEEEEATAAARQSLRSTRSPPPGARPRQPLLRNFFLLVRPTRKVQPGRGRRADRARSRRRRRRARRKWCPRERGRAEEMPGPLGPRPRPPPGQPRAPAPLRLWRAEPGAAVVVAAAAAAAADVARLPGGANNAGPAKQKGSTSPPFPSFTCAPGAPRGIPGQQGPLPWGPRAARAPVYPRTPALPPAPAPQSVRPRALGLPVPGDPAVLSPRRAARSAWVAGGPRARTHRPRGAGAGGA